MRLKNIFYVTTILFCEVLAAFCGELPPELQKCKSSNNDDCVGRIIENIAKRYKNGNPTFGLPNISALNQTNLKISSSNPSSSIYINIDFIKSTVYGLENIKILRTSGFDRDLKKVEVDGIINIKLQGDYKMTGKILLLPINGKGKGEIKLVDTKVHVRAKMEKQQRNNKSYAKIKKIQVLFEPKLLVNNFENLFDGNPEVSKTLNDVINENWEDVWMELRDSINHAGEIILSDPVNQVYNEVALEDIYDD